MVICGTGSQMREFLHVDDLADACVFLMENCGDPQHVNVGTGIDLSIRELDMRKGTTVAGSGVTMVLAGADHMSAACPYTVRATHADRAARACGGSYEPGRVMPGVLSLCCRGVRFRPGNSAAPPLPSMHQSDLRVEARRATWSDQVALAIHARCRHAALPTRLPGYLATTVTVTVAVALAPFVSATV